MDAVQSYREKHLETLQEFVAANGLEHKPIIALLAGSRKQEIKDNLTKMLEAAKDFVKDYQLVLAGAPSMDASSYQPYLREDGPVTIVFGQTYRLLQQSKAALVTSGTATLETALFKVPQVVCYYVAFGKFVSWLRKKILKVKFISLVNLVANREVVRELVADGMTVDNVRNELDALLNDESYRGKMLAEYDRMIEILGPAGASRQAASEIIRLLKKARNI